MIALKLNAQSSDWRNHSHVVEMKRNEELKSINKIFISSSHIKQNENSALNVNVRWCCEWNCELNDSLSFSHVHARSQTGSASLIRVMWHDSVISEAIVNIPITLSRLLNECIGKSRNYGIDNSLHNITLIINGHVVNDKGPINFYWSQGLAIEKLYYIIPPPRWWWPHHQTSLRCVKSEPKGLKIPKWISHSIVPLFHTN